MKEQEIRPRALFKGLLEASRDDAARLFADRSRFLEIPCPACGSALVGDRFTKAGFEYRLCGDCGSLYQSPRPSAELFDSFYRESKFVEFFASEFYRQTEDSRRTLLFRPRARLVAEWAQRLNGADSLADVGAGYGTFLEEVRSHGVFRRLIAVEPAARLAKVCRRKGFEVVESSVEGAAQTGLGADFCTCFEVFEHVHNPAAFVRALAQTLRPGGTVLFTTLTVSGFDLLELWDQSKSIMPPHHINLCSLEGFERLVAGAGLEMVDLATPGALDVDIVANTVDEEPTASVSRFAQNIITAPDATRQRFQQFLQDHRMSSHVRVIARRPL